MAEGAAGGGARGRSALKALGPEAWPDPPPLQEELLRAPRPLHSLLRGGQVIARGSAARGWTRSYDVAGLSPFKRGDDLDEGEAERLRAAMASELGA